MLRCSIHGPCKLRLGHQGTIKIAYQEHGGAWRCVNRRKSIGRKKNGKEKQEVWFIIAFESVYCRHQVGVTVGYDSESHPFSLRNQPFIILSFASCTSLSFQRTSQHCLRLDT